MLKQKQYESLKKSKDKSAAMDLRMNMREISEGYWCAGWLVGLEHILWNHAFNKKDSMIDKHMLERLRELYEQSGGWWVWSHEKEGEVFVTAEEWKPILNNPPF